MDDHQAVIAHADWIFDLSPGAGHDGAESSSRAHEPTWSPSDRPLPDSISPNTWR